MKKKTVISVVITVVAIFVAVYTLFPFYLVLMNSFKNANDIVASPISFIGASFSQWTTNLSNVINNSNFNLY